MSFNENLWLVERNIKSLLYCKLCVSWKKKEKRNIGKRWNIVIKLIGLDNEILLKIIKNWISILCVVRYIVLYS